jgi:hypothetical protein
VPTLNIAAGYDVDGVGVAEEGPVKDRRIAVNPEAGTAVEGREQP